jgi:hypothetical protein
VAPKISGSSIHYEPLFSHYTPCVNPNATKKATFVVFFNLENKEIGRCTEKITGNIDIAWETKQAINQLLRIIGQIRSEKYSEKRGKTPSLAYSIMV